MIKNNISESPFFDINNCCDLYKKLEFDFKTLSRDDMKPYYLMNYLFTSNHLYDWIKNDNNISDDIKADMKHKFNLKTKNGSGEINQEFDIIKSLCNRSKHFAYFGDIRTLKPETSGQHIGNIRTAYREHPDTVSATFGRNIAHKYGLC